MSRWDNRRPDLPLEMQEARAAADRERHLTGNEGPADRVVDPVRFYNVEAEWALLGALMIDNKLVAKVSERLADDHFFDPLNGRVYRAIVRLVGSGKEANPITLRPIFAMDADMNHPDVGGPMFLASLTGSGAALIGVFDFADQIIELARMRRIHEAMIRALADMQQSGQVAGAVDELEQEIWAASDVHRPIRLHSAEQMVGLTQARLERMGEQSGFAGVQSRTVPELGLLLGGLEAGGYTILAGRPSMGKTTLASSFAWGAAAMGHPTVYLLAEMSAELMSLKVSCDICYSMGSPIEFKRVRSGQLKHGEHQVLARAKEYAAQLPIRFADIGRADIMRVEAVIAREAAYWAAQGRRLELAVIDYLGLIQMGTEQDPRRRVSAVSKRLLDIFKKYGIHGLVLAQLSRKIEERVSTERRPQLADLRDSGDLEQDADNVVFIHRPEFYLADEKPKQNALKPTLYEAQMKDWEIDMAEWKNKAELVGGKIRLGERGSRRVRFYGSYSAVRSLTEPPPGHDQEEDDIFMRGGIVG